MTNLITNIEPVLKTTPMRWQQFAEQYPNDLLRQRPKAGEWCALECLLHLIDVEKHVFPTRVRAILAGQDFPAFDPIAEGTKMTDDMSPSALATEYASIRADSLTLVTTITADDLDKQATHAELGIVTLAHLLNEWAGHDLMHTVQAEQAMMQPFIQGCGAWLPYFDDHNANL